MLQIKTPATSANVGPGFDCLGMAFTLYNTFDVECSDTDILENVEDRYNNADNLFLQAYHRGCQEIGITDGIHAIFHCEIPSSRGLGSSASLIVAGLLAASILHDDAISENRLFQIASEMEGHPDNVAPCIFGGFTASIKNGNAFLSHPLELSDNWNYYVITPDFEVQTSVARAILPSEYPRETAARNSAQAILTIEALRTGNPTLLKIGARDLLHEPYRKTLIYEFDSLQAITQQDTSGVLLISGSGSTCLLIAPRPLSKRGLKQIEQLPYHWRVIPVSIATSGTEIRGSYE